MRSKRFAGPLAEELTIILSEATKMKETPPRCRGRNRHAVAVVQQVVADPIQPLDPEPLLRTQSTSCLKAALQRARTQTRSLRNAVQIQYLIGVVFYELHGVAKHLVAAAQPAAVVGGSDIRAPADHAHHPRQNIVLYRFPQATSVR